MGAILHPLMKAFMQSWQGQTDRGLIYSYISLTSLTWLKGSFPGSGQSPQLSIQPGLQVDKLLDCLCHHHVCLIYDVTVDVYSALMRCISFFCSLNRILDIYKAKWSWHVLASWLDLAQLSLIIKDSAMISLETINVLLIISVRVNMIKQYISSS